MRWLMRIYALAHERMFVSEVDHKIFKKLGVGLTCEPIRKGK